MDCQDVRDLSVAWIEGELSPGETEQVGLHLEACEACAEHVAALDGQSEVLGSLPPPADPRLAEPGFWDRMDRAVAAELDRAGLPEPPAPPFWRRPLRVTPVGLFFYAAALLLALGWGYMNLSAAQDAEARVQQLDAQLQRERRLAAQPPRAVLNEQYKPASTYTPRRGTF